MTTIISLFKKYQFIIWSLIAVSALVASIELSTGRSLFGPDGKFGWWESDVWSSENSQRVADAYSFSHIIHGILHYGNIIIHLYQMQMIMLELSMVLSMVQQIQTQHQQ